MDFEKFKGLPATEVNPDLPPQDSEISRLPEEGGAFFDLARDKLDDRQKQDFFHLLNMKNIGMEDLGFIKDPRKAEGILDSFLKYFEEKDPSIKKAIGNRVVAEIKEAMEF